MKVIVFFILVYFLSYMLYAIKDRQKAGKKTYRFMLVFPNTKRQLFGETYRFVLFLSNANRYVKEGETAIYCHHSKAIRKYISQSKYKERRYSKWKSLLKSSPFLMALAVVLKSTSIVLRAK